MRHVHIITKSVVGIVKLLFILNELKRNLKYFVKEVHHKVSELFHSMET